MFPHPGRTTVYAIELVAGAALVAVAMALWLTRKRLAHRALSPPGGSGRSALMAGASIAAIELPTAAPYLAVVAVIAASGASLPETIALLALFNLAFLLPLLAIIATLLLAGRRADPLLQRWGAWLRRRWPVVLAALLLLVGCGLIVAGGAGLARQ